MKKIVLSAILVTSLLSGTAYAAPVKTTPAKLVVKPAVKAVPLNVISIDSHKKAINTIKLYSKIQHHYQSLEQLNEGLRSVSDHLTLAQNKIDDFNDLSYLNKVSNEIMTMHVNYYNELLKRTQDLIVEAGKQGINVSDMNLVLTGCYDALEYYKLAIQNLNDYSTTKDYGYFKNYLNNSEQGYNSTTKGTEIADDRYFEFLSKIQNF